MVKTQIEPLSKDEIQFIMDEAQRSDEFDYMIFSVLKSTGRRLGELYGIEEKKEIGRKFTGKTRTIFIEHKPQVINITVPSYKKTGKWLYGVKVKDINVDTGMMKVWVLKRREYIQDESILTPEITRIISNYIRNNRLKLEDYLFRREGRSYRQIENVIKIYAKRAGITKNVVVHNFRHYFITELKRKGYPDEKIKKLTGHKRVSSLAPYDHIVASDLKEEVLGDLKDL